MNLAGVSRVFKINHNWLRMQRKKPQVDTGESDGEGTPVPPVDPDALAEAARRMLRKPKPPGGWEQAKPKPKREGDGK